ncbi:hypothetical protein [Ochrobactrum sp. BTU1]|uniref:hypothetical protein n=1 Tax=Ochrobactrum sp. BTU1 TaxID=2840456 RepID=UPI001C05024F|nr:hypothetical protein KMS41_16515 [Ochrobactrum sp. BTU1]
MAVTKFTPGPWLDWKTFEWIQEPIKLLCDPDNGRLIAAAPELYEALEASNRRLRTLLYEGDDHSLVMANNAALAKARGEA